MHHLQPTHHQLVWLDAHASLPLDMHSQLLHMGWDVQAYDQVSSAAALWHGAQAVVLRLAHDVQPLLHLRRLLSEQGQSLRIICRIDPQDMALSMAAMNQGAQAVVATDDWSEATWQQALRAEPSEAPQTSSPQRHVVFVDPASQKLLELARRVGAAEVTALLVGPTGAGKEVLARVLHDASARANGPFVAINCAALPENLIEDMLFGHEKGAYTGAHKETRGLFEMAQGGTLFLDEIGDMPMGLQTKLLRVLQERELVRLGGHTPIALDVRVIAATNKDLKAAMQRHEFREDLYYRISTFRLSLLSLAQRPRDILPLANQFLIEHAPRGVAYQLTPSAQQALVAYAWPGNVRELENVIQRAVVMCADGQVAAEHCLFDDTAHLDAWTPTATPERLGEGVMSDPYTANGVSTSALMGESKAAPSGLQSAVRQSEQQVILAAIQSTPTRNDAAKKLGISPRTLRYKIAQLGLRSMMQVGV